MLNLISMVLNSRIISSLKLIFSSKWKTRFSRPGLRPVRGSRERSRGPEKDVQSVLVFINLQKSPENGTGKASSFNANSESNQSISSLESQEIIKLLEETRDDECLSEGFRHLVVKLIRRNDLEGLQKAYRNSNSCRYWPIEDLVYFMEVMIQYSRFEMLEVIKEDLDEHGLFSNHNQDSVQ